MKTLLLATKNKGKMQELQTFLSDLPIKIVLLTDLGEYDDIEEDGKTYKKNSQKKALYFAKKCQLPTIADDGGIEIHALQGMPGIRTRRWLGYEATDNDLFTHMTKIVKSLPDDNRNAYFKTVVSLALPDGNVWSESGMVSGIIAKEPHPTFVAGYPFRSFFYLPKIKKYYHEIELTEEEKKEYNHRYKAIQKLKPRLMNIL